MLSHNITLNERTRLNTSCGNVQWAEIRHFGLLRAYIAGILRFGGCPVLIFNIVN